MNRIRIIAALSLAVALLGGCTRSYVIADDTEYPVSMGAGVYNEQGKYVGEGGLEKLRTFKTGYVTCNMLWTLLPLWNRSYDIGDEVNDQVKEVGGEAVTNLTVEAGVDLVSKGTLILPLLSLVTLGATPDCNTVVVRGDIVRRPPNTP